MTQRMDIDKEISNDIDSWADGRLNLQSFEKQRQQERDQAKKDLDSLKQAWINERLAPEILAFETSLLERITERVRMQMEYIEENTIELQGSDIKLKLLIVESELERIKFLIRGYLRSRLSKIDKFTIYIKTEEGQLKKLSEKEIEYMEKYVHTTFARGQDLLTSQASRNSGEFIQIAVSELSARESATAG